jgi:glycosyltransferase involved in cell wall biosynthesis
VTDGPVPDRPLRVLAVTNMYPTAENPTYGGFIETQMSAVARHGVHVEIEFINGRAADWHYLLGLARVNRLAHRGGFTVIHAHYGLCGFVCAFQSLPLVVSFWGDDLLGTPGRHGSLTLKSRLIRRISFAAARRADAINCESEEMRLQLPDPHIRDLAHVIPNGVNTERFHPGDRAAARARLGLDQSERLVLFPNTPTERRKRIDLAEAGLALLARDGIAARLWVVQGVPPAEMPDYFRAADCLLLTSDWEGSANVVKEAISCDLPVVTVDAGDARRWVSLAPGCALVAREPASIAAGLRAVLGKFGCVDGSRVRRELGIEGTASALVELYSEAVRHRAMVQKDHTGRHSRA